MDSTLPPATAQQDQLSVNVRYTQEIGPFPKGRLLNGSVGGYSPMSNLNWLPGAYDQLAEIGFQFIRLDHLTNDAFYQVVSRDTGGQLAFDFSRIDRVILPMLEHGMQPFMCLSYAPDVLAPADPEDVLSDLGEWQQVVRAYVQHYKDLGYTGWHWEVWNEPDLEMFFKGSTRRYLEIYHQSALAVKEIDPTALVGGAADAFPLAGSGKFGPLLEYVRTHPEIPLDFISYHKYSDLDGDGKGPYDLDWDYKNFASMASFNGMSGKEIFVTEWNLSSRMDTAAGADPDTNVGAAADAVKIYKSLQYSGLTGIFFFSPIEGYDPQRIFSGDLGLLTVNYHQKAAYNLFKMLTYLGESNLLAEVSGPNTTEYASYALATRDSAGQKTAVMIWNYRDQPTSLHLSVTDLPYLADGKNIRLTRYLIDADHANYYKDYAAGLRGYPVGPSETLAAVESRVLASAASFVRQEMLTPNSVSLYLLEPSDMPVQDGPVAAPQEPVLLNHAAGRPVTTSSTEPVGGWKAAFLVDEITHSLPGVLGWSSAAVADEKHEEWAMVDLGGPVTVGTLILYPRDDLGHEGEGFPRNFKIQGGLEPGQWTDLALYVDYGGGKSVQGAQVFTLSAADYRYLRVLATRLSLNDAARPQYTFQLAEFEVYGPAYP